jgi:hypothetical protein
MKKIRDKVRVMKDLDISSIFCSDRLRRIHAENISVRRGSSSKESLKRSMDSLLSDIVISLTPDCANHSVETDSVPDHTVFH